MQKRMEHKTIYQKLHKIQESIIALKKNAQAHGYNYLNGEKLLDHIKPLMNQHGLLLKQEVLSIENSRMDYATKSNPNKSEILSKVMMRFTWVDVTTGEKDENLFGANGQNDWDKGVGSALTYGERYFLLKYFHISTDEDDVDNPNRKKDINYQQPAKPTLTEGSDLWNKAISKVLAGETTIEKIKQTCIVSEAIEAKLKEAILNA
jgi:hypothetical protein